ncbi:hypothetical protein GBF38_018419 [Nibea albiflora]|uniref:Uncharacterized protein n=1 Tax=Nibea albiflora TaxID=240163 RepID=A0ACB7EMR6_NIBAL|nr:hypothetical protein GBF38_018419 [Nibea albiflora]
MITLVFVALFDDQDRSISRVVRRTKAHLSRCTASESLNSLKTQTAFIALISQDVNRTSLCLRAVLPSSLVSSLDSAEVITASCSYLTACVTCDHVTVV